MTSNFLPAPFLRPLVARPFGKAIHQASAVRSRPIAFRIALAKCDTLGEINVFQYQIDKNPFPPNFLFVLAVR